MPEWIKTVGMMLLLWCGLCLFLSFIGGWIRLSMNYRERKDKIFSGKFVKVYNTSMGIAGYQYLMLGLDKNGLYLNVPFLLRVGHPPLYIPWNQITVKLKKSLFAFINIQLCFTANPDIKLNLSEKNAKKIGLSAFINDYPTEKEFEIENGTLKRFASYFLSWLLFCSFVVYSIGKQDHIVESYMILKNTSQVQGVVTEGTSGSEISYTFNVNGIKFTNSGYCRGCDTENLNIKPGGKITVYYDWTNPKNNLLYYPASAMKTDLFMMAFVIFIFVPAGMTVMSLFR